MMLGAVHTLRPAHVPEQAKPSRSASFLPLGLGLVLINWHLPFPMGCVGSLLRFRSKSAAPSPRISFVFLSAMMFPLWIDRHD